jgi:membrane-associated phospholipid phosphatase
MLGALALTGQKRPAIAWALTLFGCVATIAGLKLLLSVCGPIAIDASLRSPSGHTALSILVYGGFAAIIGAPLSLGPRLLLIWAAAIFAFGIAVSRVILHFHSTSEVVVGLAIGCAALGVLQAAIAWCRPQPLPLRWLGLAAAIAFLLFYGDRWPAERALHRFAALLDMLRPWCT